MCVCVCVCVCVRVFSCLTSWSRPHRRGQRAGLTVCVCVCVQGFDRLAKVELQGCRALVVSGEHVPNDEDAAMLRDALPNLQPHQAADRELVLHCFAVTEALSVLMHELVAAAWTKLSLTEVC